MRGNGSADYTFTWNTDAPVPHLASIANTIGTNESYTFAYVNNALVEPSFGTDPLFSGITTSHLASMTVPTETSYQFTYDTAGAAELNQANYPDGGHIRWVYGTMQYSSNRMLREIGSRYVAAGATGGTEWGAYTFSHNDTGNPNPTIHANTTLVDASGIGAKTWNFILPDGNQSDAWKVGMLSEFVQKASASGAVLSDQTNTWAQSTAAQPYVSGSATVLDGGSSNPKTTTSSYTVDQYGNGTQQKVYDYSGALVRTYTNTYLTSATYVNAYIRSRLVSSTVVDGQTNTVTLVTNTYDSVPLSAVSGSPTEFDTVVGSASNLVRGNVTQTVSPGSTVSHTYDVTGHALSGTDATGTGSSVSYASTTNFGAPGTAAPVAGTADVQNGHSTTQATSSQLTNTYGYNNALALVQSTMPNSATTSRRSARRLGC